jgi:hypothetical protein
LRHLYWAFVLAFVIMAVGFWPSVHGDFGPVDTIRILHGLCASGWMALLIAQSWLIGHNQWRLHIRVGRASRYLAAALVITAFIVVCDMLGPQSHFARELRLTLAWLDLWSLLLFSALYILALVNRRNMNVHARYMASTVFVALPPAVARILGEHFAWFGGLEGTLVPSYSLMAAILAGLILWDARHRRFFAPFPVTLIALVVMEATMFAAPHWAPFVTVAQLMGLPPA